MAAVAAVSVIGTMAVVGVNSAVASAPRPAGCAANPSAAAVSRTVAQMRVSSYRAAARESAGSRGTLRRLLRTGAAALETRVDSALRSDYCLTLVSRGTAPAATSATSAAAGKPDIRHPKDDSDGSEDDITWDRPEIFKDSENGYWYAVGDWTFKSAIFSALLHECGNTCAFTLTGHAIGADDVAGLTFNFKLQQYQGAVTYCGDGSYYGCDTKTTAGNGVIKPSGVYFAEQDRFALDGSGNGPDYLMDNGTITDQFKTTNDESCHALQAYPNYAHDWSSTSIDGISFGTDSLGISWSSSNYRWMTQTNPTLPAVKVC
jgi:hypothetical protein